MLGKSTGVAEKTTEIPGKYNGMLGKSSELSKSTGM